MSWCIYELGTTCTYMAVQKLKIHGLGQKLNKHGWAKAENTSGDHMLNHNVVKGDRRPPVNMWSLLVF